MITAALDPGRPAHKTQLARISLNVEWECKHLKSLAQLYSLKFVFSSFSLWVVSYDEPAWREGHNWSEKNLTL